MPLKTGENKVTYGLENVHYAVLSDDGNSIVYEAPKSIPGAVEMTLDANGDSAEFFADNSKYFAQNNNQGYSGKLTIAKVTEEFEADVFGRQTDENGVIIESINDIPNNIALMFEFSGDKKKTRHVVYNNAFSRPSDSSKTTEDKIEVQTAEMEFSAIPHPYTKIVKTKTGSETTDDVYNNWYEAVYEPALNDQSDSEPETDDNDNVDNENQIPDETNTVSEIIDWLDNNGIDHTGITSKADLLALIK